MERKKKILEIVEHSRLDSFQRDIWNIFLEVCLEEQLQSIVDLLEEDKEQIYFLTENIQDKFWAMKNWDRKYLENIIIKEKNYLLQQQ